MGVKYVARRTFYKPCISWTLDTIRSHQIMSGLGRRKKIFSRSRITHAYILHVLIYKKISKNSFYSFSKIHCYRLDTVMVHLQLCVMRLSQNFARITSLQTNMRFHGQCIQTHISKQYLETNLVQSSVFKK